MYRQEVDFVLDGEPVKLEVEAGWTLIDVLRRGLGRTGTKLGCGVGVCGACSVLVDRKLVSGCLVPAAHLQGTDVATIESTAGDEGTLTPLQEAFIDFGGFQCGICTPGQVVAGTALLAECPHPTEEDIADWMTGNLCRCTGYYGIKRAILAASAGEP